MEHVIKRYRNRKLYDTQKKEYINLNHIVEMIQKNEPFRVIDNTTQEDVTRTILIQIILRGSGSERPMPMDGLMSWINQGEITVRKAFHKTIEIGREMAGRLEQDVVRPSIQKVTHTPHIIRSLEMEQFFVYLERTSEWISRILSRNIREELLQIPTQDEWHRINEKLTLLEKKIDELSNGRFTHDR